MSRKWVSVVVCALIGTVGASASNWITVWDATGTYDLRQDLQAVKITSPGVFKMNATGDYDGLGIIRSITVDPNVTDPNATVEVHVITPDGQPGAYDVRLVDLSSSAVTAIGALWVTHDLGQDGMLRATRIDGGIYDPNGAIVNGLSVETLTGYVTCWTAGDIFLTGLQPNTGSLGIRGPYSATLTVEAPMPGSISVNGNISGEIKTQHSLHTLVLSPPGAITGRVAVGAELRSLYTNGVTGTVEIYGDLDYWADFDSAPGAVWVGGDLVDAELSAGLTGSLHVGRDLLWLSTQGYPLTGAIEIGRDAGWLELKPDPNDIPAPAVSADIVVHRDLLGGISLGEMAPVDFTGSLEVDGALAAAVYVTGQLRDASGNLSGGHIIINGSLGSSFGTGRIYVYDGFAGSTEFVTVDYDGFDPNDDWIANSIVVLNGLEYTGNTPAARVYEITCLKGDTNNDGAVTFADIDPLVDALQGQSYYASRHPGLGGSWLYHADCNCDGQVNFRDIDAWVLRLTNPAQYRATYPGCEECPQQDALGQPLPDDPAGLAGVFRANLAPENRPPFCGFIRQLVESYAGTPRAAFWERVLAELE